MILPDLGLVLPSPEPDPVDLIPSPEELMPEEPPEEIPDVPFDRAKVEYDALVTAGLAHQLTDETASVIHTVLSLLLSEMKTDWESVMVETLTEAETRLALATVTERQQTFHTNTPMGAVPMSTEALRGRGDITPVGMQLAVQVLKTVGRMVQCGRGRGKCLLVLSDAPINMGIIKAQRVAAAQAVVGELEVLDLLKAASDKLKADKKKQAEEIKQIKQDVATKAAAKAEAGKIKELTAELKLKEAQVALLSKRVDSLEQELAERILSSWS